jgi:5-formyltetrahydrofolate cyclo-ligase
MSKADDPRNLLRRRLLSERAALSPEVRKQDDVGIGRALETCIARIAHENPPLIGAYWPIRGEPDLTGLYRHWPALALPCVTARDAALSFRRWRVGEALQPGAFDIPEPVHGELVDPDIVIVPCLGFFQGADRRWYRLGYGGGFYDRTLAARGVTSIGVAYDGGEIDGQSPRSHDVALDFLCTPTRCL